MKKFFTISNQTPFISLALLFLRIVVGVAFMIHGWPKIQAPFAWMGENSSYPGFLLALAALSEFGGGFSLVLGLFTKLSCIGIFSTMAFAVQMHLIVRGDPFVGKGGSYELALVYLSISLLIYFIGPGRFSLDNLVFGSKK